jgi:hypothetical protein
VIPLWLFCLLEKKKFFIYIGSPCRYFFIGEEEAGGCETIGKGD